MKLIDPEKATDGEVTIAAQAAVAGITDTEEARRLIAHCFSPPLYFLKVLSYSDGVMSIAFRRTELSNIHTPFLGQ